MQNIHYEYEKLHEKFETKSLNNTYSTIGILEVCEGNAR